MKKNNTTPIMRETALIKAKRYYQIYQEDPELILETKLGSFSIKKECLEISLYYFGCYFIRLIEDIENKFEWDFCTRNTEIKMNENAYSGVPLLKEWRVKLRKDGPIPQVRDNQENYFYSSCKTVFEDVQIKPILQELTANYAKYNISVLRDDNIIEFKNGLRRFSEGNLDQFSFLFYRCRNHVIHAGKNPADARDEKIMKDMCEILCKYTKTIEERYRSLPKTI